MSEIEQKIHFITGKGGVGKSFFAAAYAHYLADKILNSQLNTVLLAELAPSSFYQDYFQIEKIDFKPIPFEKIDISLWTPESCLKEYALYLLKVESLYKLFFQNPVSKALIEVAPGLQELAILGKATSLPRKHGPRLNYKNIVFDSPSTGHFLSMLKSPKALAQTIKFGPMGDQSHSIDKMIRDPIYNNIYLIANCDELSITETVELYQSILNEFHLTPKVILNKTIQISTQDLSQEDSQIKNYYSCKIDVENRAKELLQNQKINYFEMPIIYKTNSVELIKEASLYLKQNNFEGYLKR